MGANVPLFFNLKQKITMEEKSKPWQFVVIFLVCLLVYFLLPDRTINGVVKSDYEKIVENYDSLKVRYNAYKASGRKAGIMTGEQIDDLREIFIFLYASEAQEVRTKYRIPASVCMAQAIIESDAGTSFLADSVSNFFGMKDIEHSHSNYLNECFECCIQHPDDDAWDHFKRYNDPQESFTDYAEKISGSRRYNRCFKCGDDYKCWARRLEKAGYATNDQYAEMLIDLIERYKLQKLDNGKKYTLTPQQIKRLTGEKEKKKKNK